jgi:hypothetical protein
MTCRIKQYLLNLCPCPVVCPKQPCPYSWPCPRTKALVGPETCKACTETAGAPSYAAWRASVTDARPIEPRIKPPTQEEIRDYRAKLHARAMKIYRRDKKRGFTP